MLSMMLRSISKDGRRSHRTQSLFKLVRYCLLFILGLLAPVILTGHLAIAQPEPAIIPVSPPASLPVSPIVKPQPEIRGVWMTTNDTDILRDHDKLKNAVDQLAQLNFNTIYSVVWNSGYALYPSAIAQQAGIQPFVRRGLKGQDILADLITTAHQRGLLVMPWFEFGFMAPPSSELAMQHPEWLTQRRDGSQTAMSAAGEVVWLNPFHPEVQQLIRNLVLEVVSQYDVDGIQFDDHTCLPRDFGYDRYTIELYRKETKQSPPANPQDPAWVRWRADKITAFMSSLKQAVKARKPNAIFSISPNPYHIAYNSFLQDWLGWVRQGIADELIVQVYRQDLQSFQEQLNRPEVLEARQKIPTGAGILTGLRNRPVPMQFIQAKVRAARDRGLGVAFFFYESLWDEAAEPPVERQASFRRLFPTPAIRSNPVLATKLDLTEPSLIP